MLTFEPIDVPHKSRFLAQVEFGHDRVTEQSFATLYSWSHKYHVELCFHDTFMFTRSRLHTQYHYTMPLGRGDLGKALRALERESEQQNQPFSLRGLTRPMISRIEEALPGRYAFTENRDSADYLYSAQDLIHLTGKKYHSKRNFIARFESQFAGRWSYEDLSADNLADVWAFQDHWCRKNDCASNISLQEESTTIALLLYNLEALEAIGGLLRIDGQVVAFTVGSRIGRDTMDINVEKADYDFVGSYPMINRAFAQRHCQEVSFINREEDLGLEGLRRAKLSYAPVEILMKHCAAIRGE